MPAEPLSEEVLGQPLTKGEALAMADAMEQNFAAQAGAGQSEYAQIRATFGSAPFAPGGTMAAFSDLTGTKDTHYALNPDGWLLYPNGYMADPVSGTVLPPATNPDAEGSPAWLRKIQDEWSDKKANEWRKRLWNMGFVGGDLLQADEGGMAMDLLNALRTYHETIYLNYGKPIRAAPQQAGEKKKLEEMIDMTAFKEEVKTWGDIFQPAPGIAGELTDDEAQWVVERARDWLMRLSRRHPEWSNDALVQGARVRAKRDFQNTPEVEEAKETQEEMLLSTRLREGLIGLAQLSGGG